MLKKNKLENLIRFFAEQDAQMRNEIHFFQALVKKLNLKNRLFKINFLKFILIQD